MAAKGEVFNADLHESVTQFPAPTDDMKGKVIEEIERGYYLNDKVIRFAKVIVGN
jgi:molecular chaperone GrpE